MTAVSLGLPEVPLRPIAERRVSRRIQVGAVAVGGGAPVSVQSMTTTRTSDIGATLQQIAELTASGCQIVRVIDPACHEVSLRGGADTPGAGGRA
ncbi:flavodoxin-dependent (E)-4-hydroxy-3-methylbut-2-enyl-diphosphate synthase, partial [Streptomyces sp. BF23-18]|uniref:flavodoxin-dependent (E)-4-hydroxy-3-methylbut-2-enyl-diphosphate synthase n=1 Tax=Streptomyces sp. BF23-18 TaxID=3240282 RepID=UPI0034E55F5A